MLRDESQIKAPMTHAPFPDPASINKFVHDARTPLSVIVTGLEALKAVRNDEETFDEIIRMMKTEGADRIAKLLCDLTTMAAHQKPA